MSGQVTFIVVAGWTFRTFILLRYTLVDLHMLGQVLLMTECFVADFTLVYTHHFTRVKLHVLIEVLFSPEIKVYKVL